MHIKTGINLPSFFTTPLLIRPVAYSSSDYTVALNGSNHLSMGLAPGFEACHSFSRVTQCILYSVHIFIRLTEIFTAKHSAYIRLKEIFTAKHFACNTNKG